MIGKLIAGKRLDPKALAEERKGFGSKLLSAGKTAYKGYKKAESAIEDPTSLIPKRKKKPLVEK